VSAAERDFDFPGKPSDQAVCVDQIPRLAAGRQIGTVESPRRRVVQRERLLEVRCGRARR
jgi:hypothetical protein